MPSHENLSGSAGGKNDQPHGDERKKSRAYLRWSSVIQDCLDPLVLLSHQRRILFVNKAWEKLVGRTMDEVRGWVCRRRGREKEPGSAELLQSLLAPPPEVLQGNPVCIRRLVPSPQAEPQWWDVYFFPLPAHEKLAILVRIKVVRIASFPDRLPLPEFLVALRQRFVQQFSLENLPGEAPFVQRVREQIRLASRTAEPVTLLGEKGSGKAWLARTIHQHSDRREEFFAVLDCARLPLQLLVDVLFVQGWQRHIPLGGIYLQEPAHLPREVQEELGHRLAAEPEEGSRGKPPRILAGFATDPLADIQSGRLLPELYARLSTLTIAVPALRERMEDFSDLVSRFLTRASLALDKAIPQLSSEAEAILRGHSWPGNLDELNQLLCQAGGRCAGPRLEATDLPYYLHATPLTQERSLPLDALLEQVERRLITLALRLAKNNKGRAAQVLGIWRTRLLRRLEAFGMAPEAPEKDSPAPAEEET